MNQDLNPSNGAQGSSYLYNYGTSANTRTAVSQKLRLLAPAYGSPTRSLQHMGVVASFNPQESKNIDTVRGIGFGDKIAELVPSVTEAMTGSLERTLLYLSNLWQAAGYAAGVSGPVRSLRHHAWPFDMEQQLLFSRLADADLGVANSGRTGADRGFGNGLQAVRFPSVPGAVTGPSTPAVSYPTNQGESALITMYEACWFNDSSMSFSQDSGAIMESGSITVSDVHDFGSTYGEFLPAGNDPTIDQLGSICFGPVRG